MILISNSKVKTTHKSYVDEWLTEDKLMLIECWARDGYTRNDICKRIGITIQTFYRWIEQYPQFKKALYKGKEVIDYQVENALLKSALGYTTRETKVIRSNRPDKDGNFEIRTEITEKEIAPNTTAIAIWLNNRKPDQWKRNRDNSFELKDSDNKITVNIYKASDKKNENGNNEDEELWEEENINEKEKVISQTDKTETTEEDIPRSKYEQYEDILSGINIDVEEQNQKNNKSINKKVTSKKPKTKVQYTQEELEWLGEG